MNTEGNEVVDVVVEDTVTPKELVIETPAPKAAAAKKKKPAAAKPATPAKPVAKKAAVPKPAPAAKPVADPKPARPAKVNPSASYIGFSIVSTTPVTVNYRQGKKNVVECSAIKCTAANATGRRLDVSFMNEKGTVILERRVYKEFFEKMAKVAGV